METILRSISRTYYPDVTITVLDLLDEGDVVRECRITVGKCTVTVSSRYLDPDEDPETIMREFTLITDAIRQLRETGITRLEVT